MKGPECGYTTFDNLDRCPRCQAVWASRPADPAEKAEPPPLEDESYGAGLELRLEQEFDRLYDRLKSEEDRECKIRWGGFWRRSFAFLVDVVVLFFFSAMLFYLAYVGYRVGMAAHHPSGALKDWDFLRLLIFAWLLLVTGYFVLSHASEGQTVGKWLFDLRVVAADQGCVTYRQALIRWAGFLFFAPVGLGFLWILWDREKRSWHDLLARTWVIRATPRKDERVS